jgi:hypothetical protein
MSRRMINLTAGGVTLAGAALLTQPARASAVGECTAVQWQAGEDLANSVCMGASYTISCEGTTVHVSIVECPVGNG